VICPQERVKNPRDLSGCTEKSKRNNLKKTRGGRQRASVDIRCKRQEARYRDSRSCNSKKIGTHLGGLINDARRSSPSKEKKGRDP